MAKEPLDDTQAAIRAIRLRAMLDRKRLRHLGDPDDHVTLAEEARPSPAAGATDQPADADSAS